MSQPIADALPFLKQAKEVTAITVSEGDAANERTNLDDLISWLATLRQADLVIAGGYGHSRVREWLFGGVTRDLLKAETLTRFFSN